MCCTRKHVWQDSKILPRCKGREIFNVRTCSRGPQRQGEGRKESVQKNQSVSGPKEKNGDHNVGYGNIRRGRGRSGEGVPLSGSDEDYTVFAKLKKTNLGTNPISRLW